MNRTNTPMGDTAVNEHFWSTYSLIPTPPGLVRRPIWPLYLGLALIAVLAALIVLGGK